MCPTTAPEKGLKTMTKYRKRPFNADSTGIRLSFEGMQGFGTIRGNRPVWRLLGFFFLVAGTSWTVNELSFYFETQPFDLWQATLRGVCSLSVAVGVTALSVWCDFSVCSWCEGPKRRWEALCVQCWRDYELEKVHDLARLAIAEFTKLKGKEDLETLQSRYEKARMILAGIPLGAAE